MADKELPVSQRTAVALADLYGSYFGVIHNHRFLQNRAENSKLAGFLFKLDFGEEPRQKALSCVSPKGVRELILTYFYSGKALLEVDEDTPDDEVEEFRHGVTLVLAHGILIEVQSVWSNASESLRDRVLVLLHSLKKDGYFFYKGQLLTNQQLIDEFGVWYNHETDNYIDMREPNQTLENAIPSAEEFLLSVPLYKAYPLEADAYARLLYQLGADEKLSFDSYCIECDLSSTFKRTSPYSRFAQTSVDHDFEVVLLCTRNESHKMKFYFRTKSKSITKVGQYPSLADLVQGDVKKYRKVLGDRYVEFTRGIGLAAHGVGVGSFVYLRRIFEDLITKAYQSANKDAEWQRNNAAVFLEKKRINEKILLLKDFLPDFLVQNREMYGILSKGVHDLTEQECLTYFSVVQNGIELILDEEIERLDKKRKTSVTQKAIDAIRSSIANKPTDV